MIHQFWTHSFWKSYVDPLFVDFATFVLSLFVHSCNYSYISKCSWCESVHINFLSWVNSKTPLVFHCTNCAFAILIYLLCYQHFSIPNQSKRDHAHVIDVIRFVSSKLDDFFLQSYWKFYSTFWILNSLMIVII